MCFSATVSYSTAVVLVTAGLYAVQQARQIRPSYWILALVPLFFGIQQAFEGRVWQLLDAGDTHAAVPFAIGFHFFSHFFWLWWIPLASALVEPVMIRRRIFYGITLFGGVIGGVIYFALLLNPEWMSVSVRQHSILYDVTTHYRGSFSIGIPPSALYGLIVLVPTLISSHGHLRIFGVLIAASIMLASLAYDYAFVSVWCFFAAVISLYLVYMIYRLAAERESERSGE